MSLTMMKAANFTNLTQKFLWPEAVKCANCIYNITVSGQDKKTPFEQFTGHKPKLYKHLI